ncbi:MAG: hypothetical protein P4M05_35240 [Bradyrhizobium sp.]|nr:hypothetical protein [Bradyrhizobium sp.]
MKKRSAIVKIIRPASTTRISTRSELAVSIHRLCHIADEGGHALSAPLCKVLQPTKPRDERVALVIQVEFDPLGWKYCRTACRPAILSRKRNCGVLEQENSADSSLGIAGNPEVIHVAADEKYRDRLVDDAGIERPKWCGEGCGPIGR